MYETHPKKQTLIEGQGTALRANYLLFFTTSFLSKYISLEDTILQSL